MRKLGDSQRGVLSRRVDLLKRGPEAEGPITDSQLWRLR